MTKCATVEREGFTVPLIGIPAAAVLEECDLCHFEFPLGEITLAESGQQLCSKCNQPNKSTMKKTLSIIALGALVALGSGCSTVQDTSGKTLIGIETTVNAAMQGWATWDAEGHATPAQEAQVKALYTQYQAAFTIAANTWISAQASGDTATMTSVIATLSSQATPIVALITQIESTK